MAQAVLQRVAGRPAENARAILVSCGSLATRWMPPTLLATLHMPGTKSTTIILLQFESKKWCCCLLPWTSLLKMSPALIALFFGI